MDKIKQYSKNITPYGGLNFIYNAIYRSGIDKFLGSQIGSRSVLARYSYSDFEDLRMHCSQIKTWEKVEINYEIKEVAGTLYRPFGGNKEYRIVVTRTLKKRYANRFVIGKLLQLLWHYDQ